MTLHIDYQLKKSQKRKTIAINIKNSEVTVLAPHFVPKSYIDDLIIKKHQWINNKIAEQQLNTDAIKNKKSPLETQSFKLFGETISIQLLRSNVSSIEFDGKTLFLSAASRVKNLQAHYQKQLKVFLKQSLDSYLDIKLPEVSNYMELSFTNYQIKTYKRRWGSCNSKKELTFNVLLAGAPKWVIDYVIVHEISHLKYLDHSKRFWRLVNSHYSNVTEAESWLKINAMSLDI
ncbi:MULTISPECIES: M48 family metallopeptidase [unclassified Pseudoalteromonas]|uniref:M48 family metallopeptidase n=1 Tax=unclassified Pseudoalteromonas TaxID=194690 RepID=UPI0009E306A9|nr:MULTISPECIES: SprT family zinc-dependent metalloprotease [unclassified Pseudoalteromonas]